MKKRLLFLLVCMISALNVLAGVIPQPPQPAVILPWGANQPWDMKYVLHALQPEDSYSQPSNDGNGKNWTELGYDDSGWQTLTGPMAYGPSTIEAYRINHFSVFAWTWEGWYQIYNLRRSFNLSEVNAEGYTFAGYFDDEIKVYINGKEVYVSDTHHSLELNGIASFHIDASDCQVGENQLAIYFLCADQPNHLDYALFEGTSYNAGLYDGFEYEGVYYWFNDDGETMRVIGVNEGVQDANIRSSITFRDKTYPVTTIGARAFSGSEIETITIPSSITSIGESAFNGCTSLTSITIPESVKSIGGDAFWECHSLEKVYITDLVAWCNIDFAGGNGTNPLAWGGGKLYLNGTRVTELTIPESVTKIKKYTFFGCKFTTLKIPNTVTKIGEYAFANCSTLRTAEVLNIGSGCSLTTIEHDAFCDCSALQSVNFTEYVMQLGEAAFARCGSLTEVKLNDNLTTLLPNTFLECGNLTTVNIPNSLISIGNSAFDCCGNLSIELILPEGLTIIGNRAFASCGKLPSLSLPNTLSTIGSAAFCGTGSLRSLYIPSSVTSIGEQAFVGLINATSIVVDESNTKYDSRGYCNALIETKTGKLLAGCQNTIIPEGTTSIEAAALCSLPNTFWIVPECVEEIKEGAFSEANINGDYWTFKTLVLGSGITDIGPYICNGGGFPLDVYCYATSVPITDGAAFNWGYTSPGPGMGTLHVPAESVEAYRTTAPWTHFTNVVALTGDEHFAEIDVVIGPSGYATFSYGYALDFTGIEGLTAYVAVGGKSMLTYQAVGKVPGGTGLLLAGEEGTYKVPVILSANAISGNLLVGTGLKPSTTLEAGDYLLQNDPVDGIGFYRGEGKTLGAGKAYLHIDGAYSVKAFFLPEQSTAIQNIEEKQENGVVYNLAGQRVQKPTRGLYIVDGKKVVIK